MFPHNSTFAHAQSLANSEHVNAPSIPIFHYVRHSRKLRYHYDCDSYVTSLLAIVYRDIWVKRCSEKIRQTRSICDRDGCLKATPMQSANATVQVWVSSVHTQLANDDTKA